MYRQSCAAISTTWLQSFSSPSRKSGTQAVTAFLPEPPLSLACGSANLLPASVRPHLVWTGSRTAWPCPPSFTERARSAVNGAACVGASVLFVTAQCSPCRQSTFPVSTRRLGGLGCSSVSAALNDPAVSVHVWSLCGRMFSVLLGMEL